MMVVVVLMVMTDGDEEHEEHKYHELDYKRVLQDTRMTNFPKPPEFSVVKAEVLLELIMVLAKCFSLSFWGRNLNYQ